MYRRSKKIRDSFQKYRVIVEVVEVNSHPLPRPDNSLESFLVVRENKEFPVVVSKEPITEVVLRLGVQKVRNNP